MEQEKESFVEFSIRVPKSLNQKLQDDAEFNKRSRNKQVVFILENHYDAQPAEKEALSQIGG